MPSARRLAICPSIVVAILALPSMAGTASAQERIRFEELPDTALYSVTLERNSDGAKDPWRANGYAGVAGSTWRSAAGPQLVTPFAGLGVGAWSSPTTLLQLRTEWALPVRADRGIASTGWRDAEGAHRLRVQLGIGDLEKEATGADVEVEGTLLHAASTSTAFLRRDLPARAFTDATARATLWPRFMQKDDEGIVTPVSYAIRRVDYDGASGVMAGGFTSERVTSGFGMRDYEREWAHGWFEFIGLGWERTHFDVAPGGAKPRLGGVERIDVKFLHLDALVGQASSDLQLGVTTYLGGSWLWDSVTRNETSAFTFAIAASLRHVPDRDKPGDAMGSGFGIARRSGFMADGSALTQGWRFEWFADATAFHGRAGGSIRAAAEQMTLPNAAPGGVDLGFRSVYSTEWFFGLSPALHLGFFHVSTDRCPAVVTPNGDWCHQLGIFLRVKGETSPRRAPPTPPEASPPPSPPPPPPSKGDDTPILDDESPLSAPEAPIIK